MTHGDLGCVDGSPCGVDDIRHPELAEFLLVALHLVGDIDRVARPALLVDQDRQIAADADRIHLVEEEEAIAAEKILDVVLGGNDQRVDAGVIEESVELRRIERQALRVTDRKSLLALRDIGPESEAGSVRFHERRVTSVGQGVNTVAGRLADARINLAFSVRLTERYRATVAKTTKNQTIRKHTESAFIEPMQCKSIAALPAGEKWTF